MKMIKFPIGNVSRESHPFIVAELSANHNGSINTALKLIKEAKENGADAIKLQTYTADTLTINSDKNDFKISSGLWEGRTLYDLYDQAHTPWEWHKDLFDYANEQKIDIFSSPFDITSVDFLEDLECPVYKIASFEAHDTELVKYIASTKKPIIASTGMLNEKETFNLVDTIEKYGCGQYMILHCVSSYPCDHKDYNLNLITDMQNKFSCMVGLSDHTLNNVTAISSISLGATLIEKHFTLDRDGGGPDDSFSMLPKDLEELSTNTRIAWESLGVVDYSLKEGEKPNIKFRRSLYFMNDLKKDSLVTKDDIRSIRPGYGMEPSKLNEVIGKKLKRDIERGDPVLDSDFK